MAERKNFVDQDKLNALNDEVYKRGAVDRAHLMDFLALVDTSDAEQIVKEVRAWLQNLHDDPKFSKVTFRDGDIDAILGDLDSYGRVQPETIMQYKQTSNRTLPIS